MQTKNVNVIQMPLNNELTQKMLLGNVSDGPKNTNDAPPLPPRTTIIFARLAATPGAKVEVEGYGPYKPVPPPKPLPQQPAESSSTPPPYRMPPYPLYNEPNIPGATGPSVTSSHNQQGLQTHSSKFPIEREVILSSADKNSKIPILHDYKKRTKAAIAPDVPPKQMAAWTQAQGQAHQQQPQILSPDQTHSGHVHSSHQNNGHGTGDQSGLYRASYHAPSDYLATGQHTGAIPRSSWQGSDVTNKPSPIPRQFQQSEEVQNNQQAIAQVENGKDNIQKESKSSKSVTKTYHTIKDLISNRFKSGKDNGEDKIEETGLNNVADELRKSARSLDTQLEETNVDERAQFKKTAGEQGIYGKPRTEQNITMNQHQYNQHIIQQNIITQQQRTQSRQQAIQQYQMVQQFKSQQGYGAYPSPQMSQARSQEMLAVGQEQVYYQGSYGCGPQRPVQRYGMSSQTSEQQNYMVVQQQQMLDALNSREVYNERCVDDRRPPTEKRSVQQIERDSQKTFETRRAASHPQLACEDEKSEASESRPQYQAGHYPVTRVGSHGTIIEATRAMEDTEKDSDDGGFLERNGSCDRQLNDKQRDKNFSEGSSVQADASSTMYRSDNKIPEALMGAPRKRLEGEIGKIEGVYNVDQKHARQGLDDTTNVKKLTAESGASSDYDKPGQSSSNVDSGRGSAAYSSGRKVGGAHASNDSTDSQLPSGTYKDVYHSSGQDSEWVDVVENELRTILEPKLHELSMQGVSMSNIGVSNSTLSESISSMTPPLPPLSPGEQSSPTMTPKYKKHSSLPYGSKPDYGHDVYTKSFKGHLGNLVPGTSRWNGSSAQKHRPPKKPDHNSAMRGKQIFTFDNTDITSTTTRSIDLESMLDNQSDSDCDISTADARTIRKQLESLEGMYSEVLKLLGVKKNIGRYQPSDPRFSKRRYGSMSSLPSSSVSSRPIRDKRRSHEERKKVKDIRGVNKRFQRLESHVVTLARSVAHLSSEMRTQHLMIQEMETIRGEIAALRAQTNMMNIRSQSATRAMNTSKDLPNLTNPTRVKKLTKFFGDEPPLLRLFLRKLGYEKYAPVFENEKVGMVELPYLTEERLQKMGIPLGPRLRILQEAQISVCKENTLCIV